MKNRFNSKSAAGSCRGGTSPAPKARKPRTRRPRSRPLLLISDDAAFAEVLCRAGEASERAILQARETALQPIAMQVGQHHEMLDHLLQSPTPDPATVGQVLIETRSLEQQIQEIQQQAAGQFEQLLTPDQLQRLGAIRGGSKVCPVVPAFQAVGLL